MHDGKREPALAWPIPHIVISLCVYMSGHFPLYLAKGKTLDNTRKRGRKTRHCPPPPAMAFPLVNLGLHNYLKTAFSLLLLYIIIFKNKYTAE